MSVDVPEYQGWWQVPAGLLTQAQLAELEFPRQPVDPVARVLSEDFRGRKNRLLVDLFDPDRCPPTTASAAKLQAAAARSRRVLECAECGCHSDRALGQVNGQPLCTPCRHIQRLQAKQVAAREGQRYAAEQVAQAMAEPGAVVLQATYNAPPRTASVSVRPARSARIRAVDAGDGQHLLDVTVSLVGPRARLVDPDAVPVAEVADRVLAVLGGRTLICWRGDVLVLARAVPSPDWPERSYGSGPKRINVEDLSRLWRAEMTTRGEPVAARHPGTPDRLWLHLTRIAASHEPAPAVEVPVAV